MLVLMPARTARPMTSLWMAAGGVAVHLLTRLDDCVEAVGDHPGLILVDSPEHGHLAVAGRGQAAEEHRGVAQGGVGADAAAGRHRVDGIAE
jgi:hypothetical protein